MTDTKKVLMITHLFPPLDCGVGRQIKFVKYLPTYGWTPIILAAKKSYIRPLYDPSRIKEIPQSAKIYRTFSLEIVPFQQWMPNILEKLLGINPKWFQPVDPFIGWMPFALRTAFKIVRERKVDLIFSTSLPSTCHLVALILKKKLGLPWVADFRDPWTQNPYATYPTPILKIEEKLERAVIEYADKIVAVTDSITKGFVNKYPKQPKEKFCTIPHGFDPDDFKRIKVEENKFNLVYVGSIYGERKDVTEVFLDAVNELLNEKPYLEKELRINFVGNVRLVQDSVRSRNLEKVVRVVPHVPHAEAIKYMVAARGLLLITGVKHKTSAHAKKVLDEMSGKIMEYIATRKPILALAEENSSAAKFVKSTGTGIAIDPTDKKSIMEGILHFYKLYGENSSKIKPNNVKIKRHDVRRLTKQLSEIFEDVIRK